MAICDAFSYVWKITFSKQIGNGPLNLENTLEYIDNIPINVSVYGGKVETPSSGLLWK